MTALVVYCTMSGNLLTAMGSHYITEGGVIFEKIHPGSFLAIAAGALRISADPHGLAGARDVFYRHRDVAIFLTGIVFCIIYALVFTGTGGLIALIDTFLPAGMIGLALCDAQPKVLRRLRLLLQCLILANAGLALIEAVCLVHVVPAPTSPGEDMEFRPMALYDHPLTGAMATMVGWLLRPDYRRAPASSIVYQAIILAALIAFGERIPIFLAACLAAWQSGRLILHCTLSRRIHATRFLIALIAVAGGSAMIGIAAAAGVGQRLVAHLYWDPSAAVRLSSFKILDSLSTSELIFGTRRDDFLALIEPLRLTYRVGVIENFWLVFLVTLGIACFPFFLLSLAFLLRWLWRQSDATGQIMIFFLLTAASCSNSLGRKSMLLVLLVSCVMATKAAPRFACGVRIRHRLIGLV
jgi:hypothetical protein